MQRGMISATKLLFLALVADLTVMSVLPADLSLPTFDISDKLLQGLAYAVVVFAAASAFPGRGQRWRIAIQDIQTAA